MLGPISVLLLALSAPTAQPVDFRTLEEVARFQDRPGAIAVAGTRLFVALHPLGHPEAKLLEVRPGNRLEPYPSGVVSRSFGAVTALQGDGDGSLWILDVGDERKGPSVLGWNTVDERRLSLTRVPPALLRPNSFLAALAVDTRRGLVYLADRSRADWVGDSHPALLVVPLQGSGARRLLEDHPALEPDAVPVVVDRRPVAHRNANGTVEKLRLGVDQLALDASGTWLYLGGLNVGTVWRIRTADLADSQLPESELATRVESVSERPSGNALLVDAAGRVVVTDVEQHALAFAAPGGEATPWLTDPQLAWPDALALGDRGWMYVSVNQLNLHPALNRGTEESRPPYRVLRVQLPPVPPPRPVRTRADAGTEGDAGT